MAEICPYCGVRQGALQRVGESPRRILPAALLCGMLGVFGAHRFYVGKIGTGILQLCTIGGFGIWSLVDFIMIVVGSFRDKEGRILTEWT
jgi:TM2 domain-containing membrane protein YozV